MLDQQQLLVAGNSACGHACEYVNHVDNESIKNSPVSLAVFQDPESLDMYLVTLHLEESHQKFQSIEKGTK